MISVGGVTVEWREPSARIGRLSDMTRFLARAAGLMAGVIIGAAMAGCGSSPGTSGPGSGGPGQPASAAPATSRSLCADPAAVSRVQVARIPGIAQLDPAKPGQNRVVRLTVTDPAKARELARAVCALPRAPHGVMSCPINVGGSYQLRFSVLRRQLPLVTIAASGCRQVTGVGRVRMALAPRFWAVFTQATGISAPARPR